MGLTERQKRVFISGEQIENAVLDHYERAKNAKTIEGEMYWWTAVFHHNNQRGSWDKSNTAANLVREMLTNSNSRNKVKYYERLDDVVYGVDKDTANEIRFLEKKLGQESTMIVETPDPQMHELQSTALINFLLLLKDLCEVCEGAEFRALAYIMVKQNLDKFVEDYVPQGELPELREALLDLYTAMKEGKVDRFKWINKSRWHSQKAEKSLQEKLRSVI